MSIANPIVSRQPIPPQTSEPDPIQSLILANDAKIGRPSKYTEELAAEICARVAEGSSLHKIANDEKMPSVWAMYRWLELNETFRNNYARAQKCKAHGIAQETVDIADDADDTNWKRAQLRVSSRQWLSGKLSRETYGEGPAGNASQSLTINVVGIADQVDARLSNLIERAEESIDAEAREIEG